MSKVVVISYMGTCCLGVRRGRPLVGRYMENKHAESCLELAMAEADAQGCSWYGLKMHGRRLAGDVRRLLIGRSRRHCWRELVGVLSGTTRCRQTAGMRVGALLVMHGRALSAWGRNQPLEVMGLLCSRAWMANEHAYGKKVAAPGRKRETGAGGVSSTFLSALTGLEIGAGRGVKQTVGARAMEGRQPCGGEKEGRLVAGPATRYWALH